MVEVEPVAEAPVRGLDVESHLGDVRVEGHDGLGVTIFAFKRGPNDEVLDRLKVQLIKDASGVVRIRTTLAAGEGLVPLAAGSARIDLLIRAPRTVRTTVAIWDGRVELSEMDGGGTATANRGAIDVRKARGTWVTEGTQAGQRFDEVDGVIDATTLIGDVELESISGDRAFASVHRGRIVAERVSVRELDLRTTEGDILIQASGRGAGRYRASSYRGNVEVRLEGGTPIEMIAVAGAGSVVFPDGVTVRNTDDGGRRATVGGSRPRLVVEVRAQHGSVQFGLLAAER